MGKQRVWQFRIATWFWIVLVVATFFLGRSWDKTWRPFWRQTFTNVAGSGPDGRQAGSTVTIPAMGPVPVAVDFAQPIQPSGADGEQFSFFVGFSR